MRTILRFAKAIENINWKYMIFIDIPIFRYENHEIPWQIHGENPLKSLGRKTAAVVLAFG